MWVKFTQSFQFNDFTGASGEVMDLKDETLYKRFLRAGYIEDYQELDPDPEPEEEKEPVQDPDPEPEEDDKASIKIGNRTDNLGGKSGRGKKPAKG